MNIQSIASSSAGNCHIISSGGFHLLLDCGVPLSRIREALNHDLSKVVGCLVTHEHGDHAGYLKQLERETPIQIYCTQGTRKRFDLKRVSYLQNRVAFRTSLPFKIVPLTFDHDVQCFGFMIWDGSKKLLYATDTGQINYTIPGLTHLMIEANHTLRALIDSDLNKAAVKRICETHLSISQVAEFVERHKDLEEVHLLHMSDSHSDQNEFKRIIQNISACPVFVAKK